MQEKRVELPRFITNPDPLIYLTNKWLAIDIETTNYNKGDAVDERNHVVYGYYTSSFCGEGDLVEEGDFKALESKLYEADIIVVQGGKFELKWFKRFGIKIERLLIYDTLLGEYVLAGNRSVELDLDSISRRYGGEGKASLVSKLISGGVCPSTIPTSILQLYCRQDVRETVRIFEQQRRVLYDMGLLPVFFLRCITTPVLADIESNGLYLDREVVQELYKKSIAEYSGLLMELNKITGGINMASPQQVARFLYGTLGFKELTDKKGIPIRGKPNKAFPEGQPLTDEDTLNALQARTPEQKRFRTLKLEESKIRKKITSYIERYMYVCGLPFKPLNKEKEYRDVRGSCVMHGTINQSVTQTHRLSSSDPNLQNVDRKLKRVVKARTTGGLILSADYKTLEFTVAGILTGDKQIYQDVVTSYDVHSYTASIVYSKEWINAGNSRKSKAGDAIRTDAKPHTFKPLYGGTSGTDAERAYYDAFRKKYHVCYNTQKGWTYEVLKTGQLRTISGLIMYWPDTTMSSSGYIKNSNNIFNYPIQMFATADIAPTGVALAWHRLKAGEYKSFLINEVHDSVVAEVFPDEVKDVGNLIEESMSKEVIPFLKAVLSVDITYPLFIEQKVCMHWDYDA